LVKIPANGESRPQYLFFSRKDLEAVIADESLYKRVGPAARNNLLGFIPFYPDSGYKSPSVRVGYLAFDAMEVPFQVIIDADEDLVTSGIIKLQATLREMAHKLSSIEQNWTNESPVGHLLHELTKQEFCSFKKSLQKALEKIKGVKSKPANDAVKKNRDTAADWITTWQMITNSIDPNNIDSELLKSGAINQLTLWQRELQSISDAILRQTNPSIFAARQRAIEKSVYRATGVLQFIRESARIISTTTLREEVDQYAEDPNKIETGLAPSSLTHLIVLKEDLDILRDLKLPDKKFTPPTSKDETDANSNPEYPDGDEGKAGVIGSKY